LAFACRRGARMPQWHRGRSVVAVGEQGAVHPLTVDIRAVEAAGVDDAEFAVFKPKLGVVAADSDVVEEDVAARMAARGRRGLVKHELGANVGATFADHQGRAAWQPFESRRRAFGTGWGRRLQLDQVLGPERLREPTAKLLVGGSLCVSVARVGESIADSLLPRTATQFKAVAHLQKAIVLSDMGRHAQALKAFQDVIDGYDHDMAKPEAAMVLSAESSKVFLPNKLGPQSRSRRRAAAAHR